MGLKLDERGLEPLTKVPVHGFINDIAVGPKAKFCVVAVGQEPKLGRWDRVPKAKNRFGIVKLQPSDEQDISSSDDGGSSSDEEDVHGKDSYNEPPGVESPSKNDEE